MDDRRDRAALAEPDLLDSLTDSREGLNRLLSSAFAEARRASVPVGGILGFRPVPPSALVTALRPYQRDN